MQDFMEKWNNDPRFKTKTKLSLYTLFVVFVAIFAVSSNNNTPTNELQNQQPEENNNTVINDENNNNDSTNKIEIPSEYNYEIDITINESNYKYTGIKNTLRETITKETNNIIENYIYENDNYYIEEETDSYVLTTKEEVYDIVDYNYLNLETINEYLSKSTQVENQYLVYLKDIILGNDSEEYITITKENNKINIDYTNLVSYFDKSINQYLINIKIDEIE